MDLQGQLSSYAYIYPGKWWLPTKCFLQKRKINTNTNRYEQYAHNTKLSFCEISDTILAGNSNLI